MKKKIRQIIIIIAETDHESDNDLTFKLEVSFICLIYKYTNMQLLLARSSTFTYWISNIVIVFLVSFIDIYVCEEIIAWLLNIWAMDETLGWRVARHASSINDSITKSAEPANPA